MITDQEIEKHRIAGDITLVLEQGDEEKRQSLLRVIEKLCGPEERKRLENWTPDAENL